MANFNNLALTVNGIKALLAAQAGTTLTLSKIGMGSGSATNSVILTDLVTPELMMPISEKTVNEDSNYVTISARMTNENITEGFYWRETGLFFEDSEGNDVLFAYASVSNDQYDYIPAYSDQRYIKHVRIANVIMDSANVTIKETEGLIYVDTLTFEKHLENINNPHKVTASQVGLGNVPNVKTNDQTPTYTVPEETSELVSGEKLTISMGKIAKAIIDFLAHLKNKSNPHNVTASQVGLGNVSNVSTNNQAPTYTEATTLAKLSSGEKMHIAFGKIAKGISDLISHLADKKNPHKVTASQVGALTSSDVVDNLTGTTGKLPLSDKQGKVLNDKIGPQSVLPYPSSSLAYNIQKMDEELANHFSYKVINSSNPVTIPSGQLTLLPVFTLDDLEDGLYSITGYVQIPNESANSNVTVRNVTIKTNNIERYSVSMPFDGNSTTVTTLPISGVYRVSKDLPLQIYASHSAGKSLVVNSARIYIARIKFWND